MTNREPYPGDPLTAREIEVLAAYASGGSQASVAAALGLSTQTVKNHLSYIYLKLGVGSAVQAFRAVGWLIVPGEDDLRAMAVESRLVDARRRLSAIRDAIDVTLAEDLDVAVDRVII